MAGSLGAAPAQARVCGIHLLPVQGHQGSALPSGNLFFLKVWWQYATLFVYFLYFITYIQHNYSITFIQSIRRGLSPSPHRLWLSGKDLPVVPSRESNPGLPSSKPTRYQLSHAATFLYSISLKSLRRDTVMQTFFSSHRKKVLRTFYIGNNFINSADCKGVR
jgi:hypothetical protein